MVQPAYITTQRKKQRQSHKKHNLSYRAGKTGAALFAVGVRCSAEPALAVGVRAMAGTPEEGVRANPGAVPLAVAVGVRASEGAPDPPLALGTRLSELGELG